MGGICRYNKLSSAGPDVKTLHGGDLTAFFVSMFKRMTNKESLTSVLRHLTSDTDAALTAVDTSAPVDPFELMYTLVYQLTHRTLGCNDIANDPVQLANTLAIYKRLDHSNGLQILFPRLPTPAKLIKLWAGARLHWTFKKIVDERKRTGRREEDAMQTLIDGDTSDMCISAVCHVFPDPTPLFTLHYPFTNFPPLLFPQWDGKTRHTPY